MEPKSYDILDFCDKAGLTFLLLKYGDSTNLSYAFTKSCSAATQHNFQYLDDAYQRNIMQRFIDSELK